MLKLLIKHRYLILFVLFVLVFWLFLNSIPPSTLQAKIIFFVILFYLFLSFTLVLFRRLKYNFLLAGFFLSFVLLQSFRGLNPINALLLFCFFFFVYLGIK